MFQEHSGEQISCTHVKRGAGYIGSYAEQNVRNVTLPLVVPPPQCGAPQKVMELEFFWGLFVPGGVFGHFGWFFFSFTGFSCFVSLCPVSNVEVSKACLCQAASSLHLQVVFLLFHWLSSLVQLSSSLHLLIVFLILFAPPYSFPILQSTGQFLFLLPFLTFFLLSFQALDNPLLNPESAVVLLYYILVCSFRFQSF